MNRTIRLPLAIHAELKAIVNYLVALGDERIEKIILFGSFAVGRYQPDSDFDLCLVLREIPNTNESKLKFRDVAEACDSKRHVDVVLCTQSQLDTGGMVFKYIRRDGVLLYEQV